MINIRKLIIVCLVLLLATIFSVKSVVAKTVIIDDEPYFEGSDSGLVEIRPTWKKQLLHVFYLNGTVNQIAAIQEAFNLWDQVIGSLIFIREFNENEADIVVRWANDDEIPLNRTETREDFKNSEVLARTFWENIRLGLFESEFTITEATIWFRENREFGIYDYSNPEGNPLSRTASDLTTIALHEIGHALGLPHVIDIGNGDSERELSIMAPSIIGGKPKPLTLGDLATADGLYGSTGGLLDIDGDFVREYDDNCPCLEVWCDDDDGLTTIETGTQNFAQFDSDGDGIGDVCDENQPPRLRATSFGLTGQRVATQFNTGFIYQLSAYDPDGDPLTYSIETPADHGDIIITDAGLVTYFPDLEFEGSDRFQFRVQDPLGLFDIGQINIDVVRPTHSMVITKTGSGDGRISSNPQGIDCGSDCFDDVGSGGTVTLTAEPAAGSIFVGWDGDCSSSGYSSTCTVVVDALQIIIAQFDQAPASYHLSVNKIGTGSGTVTSDDPGIDCGSECSVSYPSGASTRVTLTPEPDSGSIFSGWNGACTGLGECEIWLYSDQVVTATFSTATPKTFVVSNLSDNGAGSLRAALVSANANPGDDLIAFAPELMGTIILESGQLEITDSVTLDGPGAEVLSISGNLASRVFKINPGTLGTVVIEGLTIKEGRDISFNGGGGIIVESGTITINNSAIIDNVSDTGGGGGGLRKFGPGVVTIINTTVSGNTAIDEFDQGDGGGIRNDQQKLTLINSTVSNNSAATGGGITSDNGVLEVINSTVTGNSALFFGGGIYSSASAIALANSIVSGNTAPVEREIGYFDGTPISRGHNIVGINGDAGITDGMTLSGTDLIHAGSLGSLIGPLTDNGGPTWTHRPTIGGPAIDVGDGDLIPPGITTDQRGPEFARSAGNVDVGAVELTAHITGTVIGPDGAGISGIFVRASVLSEDGNYWKTVSSTYTGIDGVYDLSGLTGGAYKICFEDESTGQYLAECHPDAPAVVDVGATQTGIDAQMASVAHIIGTVTDLGGSPLPNIAATASVFDAVRSLWGIVRINATDETGAFDLSGLSADTYRVCFLDLLTGKYLPKCHQDAPNVELAMDLILGVGVTLSNINAKLVLSIDRDGDGVEDTADNCPDAPNPDQADSNNNGIGDVCEKKKHPICLPITIQNGDVAMICF